MRMQLFHESKIVPLDPKLYASETELAHCQHGSFVVVIVICDEQVNILPSGTANVDGKGPVVKGVPKGLSMPCILSEREALQPLL
ncbi:hypothetical protein J6590_001792 [Homalodisca vitripennis]|nr:hypothetical protein J6590_001792 [Homalodisca vitripennis]